MQSGAIPGFDSKRSRGHFLTPIFDAFVRQMPAATQGFDIQKEFVSRGLWQAGNRKLKGGIRGQEETRNRQHVVGNSANNH
jgi:hypothetical protein